MIHNDQNPLEKSSATAAIILIGQELLSGKIKDENAFYLLKRLRSLGVDVQRVLMIPDDRSIIAEEVATASEKYDYVFTSGGVGPTHDDMTLESIADAFHVDVYLHPKLADLIRQHFKQRLTDAHLRMAQIPQGCQLIWTQMSTWPVYCMHNIYILPGVPQIFKAKFESIADRFRHGHFYLRSLYVNLDEGSMADALARIEDEFKVSIGSYPRIDRGAPYRVRITVESQVHAHVNQAVEALQLALAEVVTHSPSAQSTRGQSENQGKNIQDQPHWLVDVDAECTPTHNDHPATST